MDEKDDKDSKPSDGCKDSNDLCKFWSSIGECESNTDWMNKHCPISCDQCNGERGLTMRSILSKGGIGGRFSLYWARSYDCSFQRQFHVSISIVYVTSGHPSMNVSLMLCGCSPIVHSHARVVKVTIPPPSLPLPPTPPLSLS